MGKRFFHQVFQFIPCDTVRSIGNIPQNFFKKAQSAFGFDRFPHQCEYAGQLPGYVRVEEKSFNI